MVISSGIAEHKRSILRSTSKRVRMIFSVMASPNRIDILRILNSKGPLTYSELKSLAGFKSKKESGKFAYHLRKLLHQSLVSLNRSERRYTITNLGKLVLSLARQIEERSIIESGKMYVRTSHQSIEEFNSHKIIQSLVREGNLPLELAQKITEEAENHIYKYQTTYLTGSLIRDVVNSILLEHGHEEYRNKLARIGLPVFDIEEMLSNIDNMDKGVEGLLLKIGCRIFEENLILNKLPKDIADSYLSGYSHIVDPGLWTLLPDTIFVNIAEIAENGIIHIGGKFLDVTQIMCASNTDSLFVLLSILISLLSQEASKEVVIDGLSILLNKYFDDTSKITTKLLETFAMSSSKHTMHALISFRIKLRDDPDLIIKILSAYREYTKTTPIVRIGLIIDYDKCELNKFSVLLAEIIMFGGQIMFSQHQVSNYGIMRYNDKDHINVQTSEIPSIKLQSLTINLPRLALESNKDETYFRARLALLMKPAIASMKLRKKDISDLIRRGLTPILAHNTQHMQRSSTSLVINLVGLSEAVFDILGYDKTEGKKILYKVIDTAVDVAIKKGKEIQENVNISMIDSDGIDRFTILDSEKYGKNYLVKHRDNNFYSVGVSFTYDEISNLNVNSEIIFEHNKYVKIVNGGLLTRVIIDKNKKLHEITKLIEHTCRTLTTFKLIKPISICGNCGFKDGQNMDKCMSCNSPYIIT